MAFMKKCVFCGGSPKEGFSEEHILPKWLLKEFGLNKTKISPTHFSKDGVVISTRHHLLDDLVAGGICKKCNNEWMSQLEDSARPYILSLSSNEVSVVDLTSKERFILARWAFKTALTLNLGSNFHKNIPRTHYEYIYHHTSKLPSNVLIAAQNHKHNQNFYWVQGSIWQITNQTNIIDETTIDYVTKHSYKICFQLRGLLIVVAFNPLEDYLFSIWRGIHVPLYPKRGPVSWYEKEEFPWKDSLEAALSFHVGLELFRNAKHQVV
jgi:hypothetical protein